MNHKYIAPIIVFLISFFPAKFGYMPERSWIGFSTTIGFALTCYIPLWKSYRWKGMLVLGIIGLFGYTIESVGVLTCYPYGCFSYSEQLGPKIFDIVPYILLFTWPPLVFGVWSWIKNIRLGILPKSLLGGVILMLADLILDPIALHMGLWNYPGGGFRFGVSLSNFLGWIISGSISTAIVEHVLSGVVPKHNKRLDYGLLLTMAFFVGYILWNQVMFYFF